jgi:hypothetical protein
MLEEEYRWSVSSDQNLLTYQEVESL